MDGYQDQTNYGGQPMNAQGYNADPEAFSDFSYGGQTPGTPGYDQYGTQYTPSQMSYGGDPRSSGASTPIYGGQGQGYDQLNSICHRTCHIQLGLLILKLN